MKFTRYPFQKSVELVFCDSPYYVEVEGVVIVDVDSRYVEFSNVDIIDEENNEVDKEHPHYHDVLEQLMDLDVSEWEPEGLDSKGHYDLD